MIQNINLKKLLLIVIANPVCWLRQGVKQSPARESVAKSMRYISCRGWLRSPCTGIASLAMTIRFYFVISTPSIFAKMVPLE